MSELGWRAFLAAADVQDWVVLHGGATAVFSVSSMGEGARLTEAIAGVDGLESSGALMTIAENRLTVRLTRDLWDLESRHIELARFVSAEALAHGAVADRSAVQEVQLAIAAHPDSIDVGFWRSVLGYSAAAEDNAGGRIIHANGPESWILADSAGNRVCIAAWPDGAATAAGGD